MARIYTHTPSHPRPAATGTALPADTNLPSVTCSEWPTLPLLRDGVVTYEGAFQSYDPYGTQLTAGDYTLALSDVYPADAGRLREFRITTIVLPSTRR